MLLSARGELFEAFMFQCSGAQKLYGSLFAKYLQLADRVSIIGSYFVVFPVGRSEFPKLTLFGIRLGLLSALGDISRQVVDVIGFSFWDVCDRSSRTKLGLRVYFRVARPVLPEKLLSFFKVFFKAFPVHQKNPTLCKRKLLIVILITLFIAVYKSFEKKIRFSWPFRFL